MGKKIILLLVLLAPAPALLAQQSDHPAIENWRRNLSGATGQSGFSNLHAAVSQIEADVQSTFYDNTYAYVEATGIPSHLLGPFTGDGNPGIPGDKGHIWRINLDPQPATTLTETGLGAIGFFLNGVAMFNAEDARSWNNQGVWLRNAIFFERLGFGVGDGHPAMDFYHYHKGPSLLMAQLGENAINHSPLMGFALDGYPVYGPYGYSNANGTGAIRLITPSWQHRNITQRHTLPDGTNLNQNQWGPDISATYPIGAFIQDHHFIANSGDLDEHNGRLCITPEYPQGTYAYFITRDPQGESLYPYIVGPTYYGVPDLDNAGGGGGPPGGGGGGGGGGITIPPTATQFLPFEIYTNNVDAGGNATVAITGAAPSSSIYVGYSVNGPGPTQTNFGMVEMSMPIQSLGPFTSDNSGYLELTQSVPPQLTGVTLWVQSLNAASTVSISLPERVTVQ